MTKPINPNIVIPNGFAIEGQKTDFTEEKIENGFDPIDPDVLPGDNLNKFIDDTYKGLKYSNEGVADLYKGAVIYDYSENYSSTSIVFHINNQNEVKLYHSLIDDNQGNDLSNDNFWEELKLNVNPENFVQKSGDTMSGNLIFDNNSQIQVITDQTLGVTPIEDTYSQPIFIMDSNSDRKSVFESYTLSDGTHCVSINEKKSATENNYAAIRVGYDQNGAAFATCPSSAASNSTSSYNIATVGWVNNTSLSTNVVHRSGTETITGAKTFSGTTKVPNSATVGTAISTQAISKGGNGYLKMGNGVIIQWGSNSGSGERTVTFPTSFSSSNVQLGITHYASTNRNINARLVSKSSSNFKVWCEDNISWVAIGY